MNGALDTTFEGFFETKTAADVEGTMTFFSPDLARIRSSPPKSSGVSVMRTRALVSLASTPVVYDSRQLELERKAALIGAAFA